MTQRILTEQAKEYEAKGGNLVNMKDTHCELIEIERPWEHRGVKSKPGPVLDQFAANALFVEGREFKAEFDDDFANPSMKFGGIELTSNEHVWTKTRKGGSFGKRTFRAGGLAVGYILVAKQPFDCD